MSMEDDLKRLTEAPPLSHKGPAVPSASAPGVLTWDGTSGTLNTLPLTQRPTTWDDYLIDSGLDPEAVEVIEPVGVRAWDASQRQEDGSTSTVRMHYYSLKVQLRRGGPSLDELFAVIEGKGEFQAPEAPEVPDNEILPTFVIAIGDLQLGKMDGDGVEGTLRRMRTSLDSIVNSYQAAVEDNDTVFPIHLAWLGDCIEGFVSQGGANAWRTTLPIGEQIRTLRRQMIEWVDELAPLTHQLSVVAVPGNHDQGYRVNGKGPTTFSDSFDIESLVAVQDTVKRSASFDHVSFAYPGRDEQAVTLEVSGTRLGHVHGHQYRSNQHMRWWSDQAFGCQQVGEADILLAGHLHHLKIEQSSKRTFIQVPAMESESTWYRLKTGVTGNPGVVTFFTANGELSNLSVL